MITIIPSVGDLEGVFLFLTEGHRRDLKCVPLKVSMTKHSASKADSLSALYCIKSETSPLVFYDL